MRRLAIVAFLAVAVAALALAANGCGGGSSTTAPPSTSTSTSTTGGGEGEPAELAAALGKAAASGVPVRIPPALIASPPPGAAHAEVLRSPPDSYTLGLATQPRCEFKSTCIVAIFSGSTGKSELSGRQLELAAGIEGTYEPGRCGPGCEFGTVAWNQGGYAYGVGVPEASVGELVVLANEAIAAPPATSR